MFDKLTITNFRAITNLEVNNLGQVNLFVGANNCGKTTLLEAVFLLCGATNPELPMRIGAQRGLPFPGNEFWAGFFRDMNVHVPVEVSGRLRDSEDVQRVTMEPLWKGEEGEPVQPGSAATTASGNSTAPADLRGLRLTWSASGKREMTNVCELSAEHGQVRTKGVQEVPVLAVYLAADSVLQEPAGRFEAVQRAKRVQEAIDALKKIDPQVADLRLTANRTIDVDLGPRLPSLIPLKLMGGGVVRFLSIALAMLENRNGAVLVDEIDTGLHASAQDTLWRAVSSWAQRLNVQVLATTHSYECVAAFSRAIEPQLFAATDTKLYRIERRDCEFGATAYTQDMLAESLASGWEVR